MEKNHFNSMQDETPHAVTCSRCNAAIVPANRIEGFSERDIAWFVSRHRCRVQDESKRDFQDEVR